MDFFDFTEAWAITRPDIKHIKGKDSKNKRLFLTLGFASMADFLQNQISKASPCIVMESGAPISGNEGGWEYKDYTLYFCVRAAQQLQTLDGIEAKNCKKAAVELAKDFHHDAVTFNKHFLKNGIHIEDGYQIETFGPFWNWWYAAQLSIRVGESTNLCRDDITENILNNIDND